MIDPQPNLLSKATFSILLLTPLVYPGFFPFDVNLVLAISAALLLMTSLTFGIYSLYIPKFFLLAIATVFSLQIGLSITGKLLAPEIWELQTVGLLTAAGMLIIGISSPVSSLLTWMHLYIGAASLWSLIGLFVWLGGTEGLPLEVGSVTMALAPALKLAGPFNQGNIFATVIGFAWIFSLWLFVRTEKLTYGLAIVLFTAILFDTLSKGGWLAFIPAAVLLLFSLKPKSALLIKKLLPLLLLGIALGLLLLAFSQPSVKSNAFLSIAQPSASLEARLLIWASAFFEFVSSPLTGVGWGQFPAEFWSANTLSQAWLESQFNWKTNLHNNAMSAHNILLHTLAEAGALAMLLLLWGIWKLLRANISLLANSRSNRLPFALAAMAFVLQSQFNISYNQPIPLFMGAFFSGIALAPWLRKNSWKMKLRSSLRGATLLIASITLIWATQITLQWFSAEKAIRDFDIQNENSIRQLAEVATTPRIGAIPLIWLGYNIAVTKQHSGLLTWMLPYLKKSTHEIPYIDSYQVQFYALSYSHRFEEACRLGQIISARNLPGEKNKLAYKQVCEGKEINSYEFGL